MMFNPLTKELYTNSGEFIKQLQCPINMRVDGLKQITSFISSCSICMNQVLDSSKFMDDEMLSILMDNDKTCLKIDLNQENIIVTTKSELK
jgi:hypothetical protein